MHISKKKWTSEKKNKFSLKYECGSENDMG